MPDRRSIALPRMHPDTTQRITHPALYVGVVLVLGLLRLLLLRRSAASRSTRSDPGRRGLVPHALRKE